jgi:ketosteroid isomerase-like protein
VAGLAESSDTPPAVGERNLDVIRSLYGFDWIGIGSRERGFEDLKGLMAPDFRARVSPELGDRELQGIEGMTNFIDALEQDFDEFRYVGDRFSEAADGRVVVSGRILARGRASKMPLASEFGHLWSLREGTLLRVEAFLDRAAAERAAGM